MNDELRLELTLLRDLGFTHLDLRNAAPAAAIEDARTTEAKTLLGELEAIASVCVKCELAKTRTQVVYGVGNPNADLIVANDVADPSIGFDSDQNAVTVIARDGSSTNIERAPKIVVANRILDLIVSLIRERLA